jgi:hypothetical protein
MASYALLFRGGRPTSELTRDYFARFASWARSLSSSPALGSRFKQEGRVVSISGVEEMKFGADTIGGYVIIEADSYEHVVELAKGCPILENSGAVEIREVLPR